MLLLLPPRIKYYNMTDAKVLEELWKIIQERKASPKEGSYTCKLFEDKDLLVGKLREEVEELVSAAESSNARGPDSVVHESADLIYHLLVLLESEGVDFSEVLAELESRMSR